jgi:hypothetical protein
MGPITSNFFGVAARPFCVARKQVQRDYAATVGVAAILHHTHLHDQTGPDRGRRQAGAGYSSAIREHVSLISPQI